MARGKSQAASPRQVGVRRAGDWAPPGLRIPPRALTVEQGFARLRRLSGNLWHMWRVEKGL